MTRSRAVVIAISCLLASCASPSDADRAKKVEGIEGIDLASYRARLERVRGASLGGNGGVQGSAAWHAPDVKVAAQTVDEFKKRLREELDRDLPEPKARAVARSLSRIGLLPEGFDLRAETVETTAVQAFAYYDPREKTFYLLKPDAPEQQ